MGIHLAEDVLNKVHKTIATAQGIIIVSEFFRAHMLPQLLKLSRPDQTDEIDSDSVLGPASISVLKLITTLLVIPWRAIHGSTIKLLLR